MGGESQPSNQTQTVVPWSGVQPYLLDAYEQLSSTRKPTYFPGQTVVQPTSETITGTQALTSNAGTQQQIADTAKSGLEFSLTDMLNPESNTYLQQHAQAAIKPIFENLERNTLGNIDDAAILAGQFGGTAQRGERVEAIDQATQRALDTTAGIYSNAYETSLDNYTKALLGSGVVQGLQTTPAQSYLQAGDILEGYDERQIAADMAKWNFDQTSKFDYLNQYINTLLGVPMGSQTVATGGGTSGLQSALAGGALGYGASTLPMFAGMSAAPWLFPLIGAGAALAV